MKITQTYKKLWEKSFAFKENSEEKFGKSLYMRNIQGWLLKEESVHQQIQFCDSLYKVFLELYTQKSYDAEFDIII